MAKNIPKGWFAVTVGQGAEQRRRFVIPVEYVNHPRFVRLLEVAEEEYGFEQRGLINIPCHVEEFCQVRCLIDKEMTSSVNQRQQQFLCFKA